MLLYIFIWTFKISYIVSC